MDNIKLDKIFMAVLLLLVFVLGSNAISSRTNDDDLNEDSFEAVADNIIEMPAEEQEMSLDKIIEDGMINISYQPYVVFNGSTSENFKVSNSEDNKYPIQFIIFNENDEIVYSSKKIDLGYELTSISLDEVYPNGEYEWRITIGYVSEEGVPLGNVSSSFPLKVTIY